MYQSIILKTEQLNLILKPLILAEFSQLSYLYVYYKLKQSLKQKLWQISQKMKHNGITKKIQLIQKKAENRKKMKEKMRHVGNK